MYFKATQILLRHFAIDILFKEYCIGIIQNYIINISGVKL